LLIVVHYSFYWYTTFFNRDRERDRVPERGRESLRKGGEGREDISGGTVYASRVDLVWRKACGSHTFNLSSV
jgi:hypothetical protein